jgi:hypothetical protein
MPSIPVVAEVPSSSPVGGPVIGGVEFRRPTSRSVSTEPVGSSVELGSGSLRRYTRGVRKVFAISWAKMTEDEVAAVELALAPTFVTFQLDSTAEAALVATEDGFSADAIAGTFPIRYNVSLSLREKDPRR